MSVIAEMEGIENKKLSQGWWCTPVILQRLGKKIFSSKTA
jgi:hypothetical protein